VCSNALSIRKQDPNQVCKSSWAPKAGGFSNVWDTSKAIPFANTLEFYAKGNDIYVADFDQGSKTWSHLFIISGWGNTEAHVYRNGDINTAINQVNMVVPNVNSWNLFKIEYDEKNLTLKLWLNGKEYINYKDPLWKTSDPKGRTFVFSQYGSNVQICNAKSSNGSGGKCKRRSVD